jgi:hypothetical protein
MAPLGGIVVDATSGVVGAPSDLALAARALADPVVWPGVPLAPASAQPLATAVLYAPGGALAGPVTVLLIAIDGAGGVGVALANTTLGAPPAADAGAAGAALAAAAAAAAAAGASGDASAASNPFAVLLTSHAAAQLVQNATGGAVGVSSRGGLTNGTATAARADVAAAVASALAAIAAGGARNATTLAGSPSAALDAPNLAGVTSSLSASGIVLDNGALFVAVDALRAAMDAPAGQLSGGARTSALAALATALALATPNVSALATLGPAAMPPLPPAVGSAALAALASLVAGAAGEGASSPALAPLATGGVDLAAPAGLATSIASALDALAAAALRSVSPGDAPLALTASAGAGASGGGSASELPPSYCGGGMSLTLARLSVTSAQDFILPLRAPFNPCANASGAALRDPRIRLPAAIVAAQPPPTLGVSAALLRALATPSGPLAGVGAVDVAMVQWALSPHNETAGLGGLG